MRSIGIGCGSGWFNDRLEPALALADSGAVDCLAFDCLAERTLALAQMRRMDNPAAGQDLRVARIAREFAPFLKRGKQIIGNFGAANPGAAVSEMVDALRHAEALLAARGR